MAPPLLQFNVNRVILKSVLERCVKDALTWRRF